jgi:glutamate-ammonia-ligase adenylyltransferase
MVASDNLTFLAEVMVNQAIQVARAELVTRHGEPQGDDAGFAVMGYGKLGGIELGYGSDLDLVFVYDGGRGTTSGPKVIENTRFFTRLAQRVVHVLSTNVAQGRLYEVDLRLRPDGGSGLPCVNLGSFQKYQHESAWTWEHQALVRARPVAGSAACAISSRLCDWKYYDSPGLIRGCVMLWFPCGCGCLRVLRAALMPVLMNLILSVIRAVLLILNLWCNF